MELPKSIEGGRGDRVAATIALFCFSVAIFLAKANESTLPATDAATHAELAMNATAHGLIPKLPLAQAADLGSWGAGYNDHPFLFFYVSGWVMRFFGPDAWSAKLLPGLFSVGCVMLTLLLGRALRSTMLGLVAGVILCLSRHFIIDGLNAHLDNVMMFFILASFILWERERYSLAGVAAGIGVWFKSPVAFLLFPAAFIAHSVRFEIVGKLRPLARASLIAVAVASVVWIATGLIGGWDLVRDYWVRQFWGTAVGGRGGTQEFDPFTFVRVLRSHYMPWSVFLAIGLTWNVVFLRIKRREFAVPAAAAAVVIVAISSLKFKYEHYFVPAYPFLALVAAQPLAFWFEKRERKVYRVFTIITLLGLTYLLATPINPSPESFPSLRRFMAYIESRGDCRDKVVMVEGGQPYGTYLDYSNLLHFYTGRRTEKADCQTMNLLAQSREVKWILLAGKNFPACVDDSVRKAFSKVLTDGDQILLARTEMVEGGDGRIDLTPLNRELKAVVDCVPPPLLNDNYHSY